MEYKLKINDKEISVLVEKKDHNDFLFTLQDQTVAVNAKRFDSQHVLANIDGRNTHFYLNNDLHQHDVHFHGKVYNVEDASAPTSRKRSSETEGSGEIKPPMPGNIIRILVKENDVVAKGEELLVMSAMKMETTLSAPFDAKVKQVNVGESEQVMPDQILVLLEKSSTLNNTEEK